MRKAILVKYEFVGYHKWANASDAVAFLRNDHRHMFHIEIEFPVNHNDRDLEFYLMREQIKSAIGSIYKDHEIFIKGKTVESCEQIGEDLANMLNEAGREWIVIRVSEDGDNGAVIYNS